MNKPLTLARDVCVCVCVCVLSKHICVDHAGGLHDAEQAECGGAAEGGVAGVGALAGGLLGDLVLEDELEGAAGGLLGGLVGPARLLLVFEVELVEAALDEVVLFGLGLVEAPGETRELAVEGALVLAVPGGLRHAVVVLRMSVGWHPFICRGV